MVTVRPTIKVLKTLNASDKLPPQTEKAYRCAVRADERSVRGGYLREAVAHAQDELALVTYIQKRFDQGVLNVTVASQTPSLSRGMPRAQLGAVQ